MSLITRARWEAAVHHATSQSLFPDSVLHGENHWRAVAEQGQRLADILRLGPRGRLAAALFGLFHDCRRENDGWDAEHGQRGAAALAEIAGGLDLPGGLGSALQTSLIRHDDGQTTDNPIIGLGWDADRSTLGRVGIMPSAEFFSCVPTGRFSEFIEAGQRATRSPPSWDEIFAAI